MEELKQYEEKAKQIFEFVKKLKIATQSRVLGVSRQAIYQWNFYKKFDTQAYTHILENLSAVEKRIKKMTER